VSDQNLSLRHVRRNCLACSGGIPKQVTWCSCDGLHSIRCEFWLFRFGSQPATFRHKYGDRLLTPEQMPPAEINLDDLPGTLEEAAFGGISVDGYHQLEVDRPDPATCLTPEERERRTQAGERLRRMHRERSKASKSGRPLDGSVVGLEAVSDSPQA